MPYRKQPKEFFEEELKESQNKYNKLKEKFNRYKDKFNMNGSEKMIIYIVVIISLSFLISMGYIASVEIIEELALSRQTEEISKCLSKCETKECRQKCIPSVSLKDCLKECNNMFGNETSELKCSEFCFKREEN